MRLARSKWRAILLFSMISATVGLFLQFVIERIRWVGYILAWVLGTLWSLGTLFVIPLMVTADKPQAFPAIKQSIRFFKQTWGESVISKISVNLPLALLNMLLLLVFFVLIFVSGSTIVGFILVIIYICLTLVLAVVGSFANSAVNVALFYYAQFHQVPPAFDESLLNQVFIKRNRRFFKKKNAPTS